MGEIKSALELAMERSRKYQISEGEKEKIKQKEILQRASGLFHRYRDGHLSLNEIEREIGRLDDKAREGVREALLSQWVESLSLEGDFERILKGIEWIRKRDFCDVAARFKDLRYEYGKTIEAAGQRRCAELAKALRESGIGGDAVEPNLDGSEEWTRMLDSMRRSFEGRLEGIRDALRAS